MQTRREFIGSALLTTAGVVLSCAAESSRWQIGCYTRPWDQYDWRVALDGIAEAGYKYAGLMTAKTGDVITVKTTMDEAATIGGEARKRGLKITSIYGGGFPLDNTDGLKRLIDNSAACSCPNLLLGGTDEKHSDAYYKIIADCCEYAVGKNIGLSVKPHGGNNANGVQCRKLVEKVGHKNFRIWYDPGNIFYYSDGKLNPVDDAATVGGLVVGMSVKDFCLPKNVMVTPGTGQVNFAQVFARLEQGGFTSGPLIVECVERGDVAHITAEAKRARQFLENVLKCLALV